MPAPEERLRLTELLASLSLATDLGTGQALGHGLRTSLLAVEIARRLGLDDESIRSVQQVSLLRFLGCTSDAAETAAMAGGDDISFNARMAPVLFGGALGQVGGLIRAVAPEASIGHRTRMVLAALADPAEPARSLSAHCEVAAMLARRLALGDRVTDALESAYERWDGKGHPHGLEGEAIPIEVRIAIVAREIDVFSQLGANPREILRGRRGQAYDPTVVDASEDLAATIPDAELDRVLAAEPEPVAFIDEIGSCLEVMAYFVDLKSPWARGHSTKVAELAEAAAGAAGLSADRRKTLRWAGLIHDVGRVGVENGIWDKPGPLTTSERESVELHPYLTDRVLSRCAGLGGLAELASHHHERLDGSGYHRRTSGDGISNGARLLAAADVMAALSARRPHRPRMDLDDAAARIRQEAADGRLDAQAVESVIAAAGGEPAQLGSDLPDGLTDREVEVLVLLCGGHTNRQVGEELYISPKTVGRHVENIYAKIGVSTRAGAAVYAMENSLLDRA